jgi:fumarate hydratase class II
VVPAISEQRKDVCVMEKSMIGVGLMRAARTVLVDAAAELNGMDLSGYRSAVRAARERAIEVRIGSDASDIAAGGNAPEAGVNGK